MATPALATLTFDAAADVGGARRPSLAGDIGGAILANATDTVPQDGTHLHALIANQWQKLLDAYGRVVSPAIITIDFATAVPFIDRIQCASAVLVAGDFTVFDDGTGITRIEWTSTKLPAPTCDPELTINGGSAPTLGKVEMKLNWSGSGAGSSTPGTHRIIITTWTSATEAVAAALVNVRCTIRIN